MSTTCSTNGAVELCPGGETSKTSMSRRTTTRHWNVNVLLHRRRRRNKPLFWEKTKKTSMASKTTSWNFDGLLDRLPKKDTDHVRRHFHQLLRHLRCCNSRAKRTGWPRDLGRCDTLLGNRGIEALEHGHQSVHHLRHRYTKSMHHGRDVANLLHGVPQNPLLRPDANEAVRPRPAGLSVKRRAPAGEGGGLLDRRRVVSSFCTFPPPRPWPSSGAVRCGAGTWPGPQRSTAARVATTSAVVAAAASTRLHCRGQP